MSLDREVPEAGGEAAVVVPVSGAPELLANCLSSLAVGTDSGRHSLILVLDGPQTREVEEVVARRPAALAGATIVRLPARGGFVRAANAGLRAAGTRDVVLLNSDTEVPPGWVGRLAAVARSSARIASVTPLTNHGTIASVPRTLRENALPAGHDVASFDRLIQTVSRHDPPRAPTGVGFCIYLTRAALEAVGEFDETAFGEGYGEEVDWCLRAGEAGWEHRIADSVFVYHRGGASFGARKAPRERRGEARLRRRHGDWRRDLSRYLAEDPLRPARERIVAALRPPRVGPAERSLRVLHVVHGWPPWNFAGTELYAQRLAHAQAGEMEVAVFARIDEAGRGRESALELEDRGARVRLVQNDFSYRSPWRRNALANPGLEGDFARFAAEVGPEIVHVHHLAGHSLRLPRFFPPSVPVVWQVQDWWHACARANLLDAGRQLCAGPGPAKCGRCLPLTARAPRALWNRLLYRRRARLSRQALGAASIFVAGSAGVLADLDRFGVLPSGTPRRVLDYGVPDRPAVANRPRATTDSGGSGALRLGFVGSLLPHKGLHLLATAIGEVAAGDPAAIELTVWGRPRDARYLAEVRTLAGEARLALRPPFAEGELGETLAGIDLLVVPSLGLESYALAPREALTAGVPVLVARRGVLAELATRGGVESFDPERPAELASILRAHAAEPERRERLRAAIAPQRRFAEHAAEIAALYRELLARPAEVRPS